MNSAPPPKRARWALAMQVGLLSASAHGQAPATVTTTKDPTVVTEKARTVSVPTVLAGDFVADWTVSGLTAASHRAVVPTYDLVEKVRGHVEVRHRTDGADGEMVAFRGRSELLLDKSEKPAAKPEVVFDLFTPGRISSYNVTLGQYRRLELKDPADFPDSDPTWMDWCGLAVHLGLGSLRAGTNSKPEDGTVDGAPAKIYTLTGPTQTVAYPGETHTVQIVQRYYFSRDTGLPLRFSSFSSENGGPEHEFMRLQVTNVKPVSALPDERFALDIPTTAKEWEAPKRPSFLSAGTQAPDFTCIGPDGNPLKLSDLKGKIVILDFWATWCGPCKRSFPHLQSVWDQIKNRSDVTVLALCVWDEKAAYDAWRPAHVQYCNFPMAFDPAGSESDKSIAKSKYNVSGIPTQYVIDRDGKIVAANDGFMGDTDHRLEAELAKLGVVVPVETKTASK